MGTEMKLNPDRIIRIDVFDSAGRKSIKTVTGEYLNLDQYLFKPGSLLKNPRLKHIIVYAGNNLASTIKKARYGYRVRTGRRQYPGL
jgi:hypothetical protein